MGDIRTRLVDTMNAKKKNKKKDVAKRRGGLWATFTLVWWTQSKYSSHKKIHESHGTPKDKNNETGLQI